MGEGLHYLAYSLTRDPTEEIRGALADVSAKTWSELSLDKIVESALPDGIEAEVLDAPVSYQDNKASYRAEATELPSNYQDSGYKSATDDDDDAEVTYSGNVDVAWEQAAETYEQQLDAKITADILKVGYEKKFVSSEQKERVEHYNMVAGFSMNCLLYAIKSATQ